MLKALHLPELAEGVTSAVVVAMLVKPGDRVDADQIVAELENDKATAELPIPFAGTVRELFKKAGDDINVGELLLSVEVAGEGDDRPESDEGVSSGDGAVQVPTPPQRDTTDMPEIGPVSRVAIERTERGEENVPGQSPLAPLLPAGPEVRRLARELGVDLSVMTGTGPRGRITPHDVKMYAQHLLSDTQHHNDETTRQAATDALPGLPDFSKWGEVEERPMSGVRRKTAAVVALSWHEIPHVSQQDQADITTLEAIRNEWQPRAAEAGTRLTITAMLLKVVAAALKVHPKLNCSIDMVNHKLIYKNYIHLAVAVDAGHGLLTPVIRNADEKSIFTIAGELATLSAKARDKRLSSEEMAGSTFAVSNLGALGTTAFNPIVTWPHVAVLGVGKAEMRPVWRADAFEPRKMLPLSLSYDHRANDGADAARFLRFIAEAMEQPLKIIMEAG